MKYISVLLLITFLVSCNQPGTDDYTIKNSKSINVEQTQWWNTDDVVENIDSDNETLEYKEREIELDLKDQETVYITLDSENTTIVSDAIQITGQKVTIKKSWNYEFTWVLSDGQIIVDTDDEKNVQIILNNVEITNYNSSTIVIENTSQAVITLSDDSKNILIDGEDYILTEDDSPNANIFSTEDLVIRWNWELEVIWNYNDWITSKDKLFIDSWDIKVTAADDWIRWKDYIEINWWNIEVIAEGDSIKSDDDDKWTITINGWNIELTAWDDAINSTIYLTINWWTINILKSYEGIESQIITFNWWEISVLSSDDWINAASSTSESSKWENSDDSYVYLNWWNITLNSSWDWFDSNWNIEMNGWKLLIYWPEMDNNGSIDYNWVFEMNGWELLSIWSSWMVETPSESEYVNIINIWLNTSYWAWENIVLSNLDWDELINIYSIKRFQNIVFWSNLLETGEIYILEISGEKVYEINITDKITTVWEFVTSKRMRK